MTFPETIQYLESFIDYEKITVYPYKESLKLERIKGFLKILGDPQEKLRCIHVAGTKGKGSTCVFITYILRQAGFRVGLYTSPHLSDFRERIRILAPRYGKRYAPLCEFEGMIGKKGLARIIGKIKPKIREYNKSSEYGPLTFFEIYTAAAFIYFFEQNTDFVVLETGLGGRLDATNAVNALVCVITPISLEHTQKLGNTIKKIAGEKAGIIKAQNAIVISAPQKAEARRLIRKRCLETGAKLYEVGKDIHYRVEGLGFRVKTEKWTYSNLRIRLLGRHQIVNAAAAVAAIEALREHDFQIGAGSIRIGLSRAFWPARCEIISRQPLIILDGAQNAASARALKATIKDNFHSKRLILVLGISSDKDIRGICAQLCPFAQKIILTQADNPRAARVEEIEKFIARRTIKTQSVRDAVNFAKSTAGKDDMILVTGSLFVAAEAREICGI